MMRNTSVAMALAAVIGIPSLLLMVAHRSAGSGTGLLTGQVLPRAQLVALDGRLVDTRAWKGTPTLLVLIQSTCRACEREIEGLRKIAPSFPGLGIQLLAIDSAAPRNPTGFPVLSDPSGQFLRKVRRVIVPTLYLLNTESRVVYVRSGQRPPEYEMRILARLLSDEDQ
jgi:peroxiredoxin